MAISASALSACGAPPINAAGPTGDGADPGFVHPQGTELQAAPRSLEGFFVDATGWSRGGAALAAITVVDGALVTGDPRAPGAHDLTGATFSATRPDGSRVAMRITGAVPHINPWGGPPPLPDQRDYLVEYADGTAWQPLCPADAPAAIPLAGSFSHGPEGRVNGDYDPAPARLTFACRDGVAAKCQDWGYRPHDADTARHFQACTRMARADYCGNGHSRTVDGTTIEFLDLSRPLSAALQPLPGFVPEAVWGAGGPNAPSAALCLSRVRWATVPLGPRSPCADLLPDPREPASTAPHQFCDERSVAEWAAAGALFVNNSKPLDVGLTVWSDGKANYLTTTQFPWLGSAAASPSPPGYPVFVSIEGSAYKPELTPPRGRSLAPLIRYTRKLGGQLLSITTTGPAPGGFGDPVREAYVFAADAPADQLPSTARALYLHTDRDGHHATTSDAAPPAGFVGASSQKIGFLPH